LTVTVVSCHRITGTERTKRISLLAELKNCMMLCQSTVTLCLVSNKVSISFLVMV
jgi:hypothetical protein